MRKHHYIILFSLLVVAQLTVAGRMILQQENIIQKGHKYLFKTVPIDPLDPFRGKYITLRFEAEEYETEDLQPWQPKDEVYVLLTTDVAGFAQVHKLSRTPPQDGTHYFTAVIDYFYAQDTIAQISLDFPFDRFYMEESKAPKAEKVYRDAFRDTDQNTFAIVFINKGQSVLDDVQIEGTSIRDLVSDDPQN